MNRKPGPGEMRLKTAVAVVIAVCTLALLGVYGFSAIAAETQSTYNFPPIIQKLIEKFNLDPAKVDEVFQEQRKEMKAKQQENYEQRLEQAVKDGKLTEKQKEAILSKWNEIQTKLEALSKLSPEERQKALKELRDDTEKWAKDNGIDARFLMFGLKGRMHPMGGFWCGPGKMGRGFGRQGWFGPPGVPEAPQTEQSQ